MRVPLSWLKDFIELPTADVEEITYAFDMLGLTVDGVENLDIGWSGVVVGRVIDVAAHPDADKIRVCQVDSGSGPEQIICGAWNFDAGATVAVAKPGALLPGDFEITRRTIRGVDSNGMICSEAELGLGEDHSGILVLDGNPEIGVDFAELVELPDVVFDLDVTPNRPDALSMIGVARDLGAYFDIDHHVPPVELTTVKGATDIAVQIEDAVGCRRFTAREIRGVKMGTSPLKVRHRLHKVGTRAISNVVDATNYVMFELGHPLHAFDADSIAGGRLTIRRAQDGETIVTLDGEERELVPEDLIIYDDDGPTSMSGTMGGARSEVSASTTRVLMEAASWDPPTIMRMWRRHDLRSEAATRFERGVDPELADIANKRASALVAEWAGGEVLEGAVDEHPTPVSPAHVTLSLGEVERLLGPGFEADGVTRILERLGMEVKGSEPMEVTVPTFRPDVTRPADLIEEVARVHGFDKFGASLPTGPAGGLTPAQRRERTLRSTLASIGLDQAVNLPFVGEDDVAVFGAEELLEVKNPLSDEEAKLRPTLLPGLLRSVRYNISHGVSSVGLFETGKVFFTDPDPMDSRLPRQVDRLGWVVAGKVGPQMIGSAAQDADGAVSLALWRRLADALGLRDYSLTPAAPAGYHPGRTAEVTVAGKAVGFVGELSPRAARSFDLEGRVAAAELDMSPLVAPVAPVEMAAPSPYPHVDFDLSFLMERDKTVDAILAATKEAAGSLLERAVVFDEFTPEELGENKAVAIRYRLRAPDKTLTNEEVAPVREAMIAAASDIGAKLRGL
ncbi:MAG: phenylalanine--tRNA ligase subunit beta [Acidimicrobiia bacterium]|nr:phenylalanine--tRNA ligase subunit beta [Acidimicrobiia bacterium]